jgi:hypothetical protein
MLKSSELKLYESQERMSLSEKKNAENTRLISELTAKVCEHLVFFCVSQYGIFHCISYFLIYFKKNCQAKFSRIYCDFYAPITRHWWH